jgi:peptide/nickel transport system substrate-binding protein
VEQRNDGRFDAAMSGWALSPFPDQTQLYHSGSMEDGLNFFGLSDPEVDRLLERGRTLLREEDRIPVYRALHRRLHELQPVTCLFQFASPVLHRPELGGIVTSPIDIWRTEPGPKAWTWNPEP